MTHSREVLLLWRRQQTIEALSRGMDPVEISGLLIDKIRIFHMGRNGERTEEMGTNGGENEEIAGEERQISLQYLYGNFEKTDKLTRYFSNMEITDNFNEDETDNEKSDGDDNNDAKNSRVGSESIDSTVGDETVVDRIS